MILYAVCCGAEETIVRAMMTIFPFLEYDRLKLLNITPPTIISSNIIAITIAKNSTMQKHCLIYSPIVYDLVTKNTSCSCPLTLSSN